MDMLPYWVVIAFFFIALFYSMVGFGGGSSYLAILVLSGLAYQTVPPLALSCNLIVSTCGFWYFYRAGHFRWNIVAPFAVMSIPMAYAGGCFVIGKELFCLLLGFSLFCAAVRMLFSEKSVEQTRPVSQKMIWALGLPLGSALGFLSGVVGIGGGIFLSPALLFLRWVTVKEAAACASFFIIVNSLSGLAGHMQKGFFDIVLFLPLAVAVLAGGQIGSRLGASRVTPVVLRRVLAVLILYVSGRLLWVTL